VLLAGLSYVMGELVSRQCSSIYEKGPRYKPSITEKYTAVKDATKASEKGTGSTSNSSGRSGFLLPEEGSRKIFGGGKKRGKVCLGKSEEARY